MGGVECFRVFARLHVYLFDFLCIVYCLHQTVAGFPWEKGLSTHYWILRLSLPAKGEPSHWLFFRLGNRASKRANKRPFTLSLLFALARNFVPLRTFKNKRLVRRLLVAIPSPRRFLNDLLLSSLFDFFFSWAWRFCVAEVFCYFIHFHSRIALVILLPG